MTDDENALRVAPRQLPADAFWLHKREAVIVLELEGQGSDDAIAVIDAQSGRMLAFLGPDFPSGHRLAGIDGGDMAELIKLFDHGVDAWFAPRMRGLVIGTTQAILYGWSMARDARALLSNPNEMPRHRQGGRFLRFLITADIKLTEALEAFPSQRGKPPDETRAFFFKELARVALDNGMELRLPHDQDQRQGGVTPFFTFVLAAIDIVLTRVHDARSADRAVRHRAARFDWTRIAQLHALRRIVEDLSKSKT
jgi:hypothetical protein